MTRYYYHLDEKLYDKQGLEEDFRATAKQQKSKHKKKIIRVVLNNLDPHTEELARQLKENSFTKKTHKTKTINENSGRKVRKIMMPEYLYEQPAHHALIRAGMDVWMDGMHPQCMASIPNRGSFEGKKIVERWIRDDPKNCKYVLKLDIHHFFESVSHRKLKKMLKHKIKDKDYLKKLFSVINACPEGLPIGFYTSQWLGNFFLTPLDWFISSQEPCKHYMRYMDDIVVFGSNKRELHRLFHAIQMYLKAMGLEVKKDWQIFKLEYRENGRPLDFMGFKFYNNRVCIRKSILKGARRKANRIKKKEHVSWIDCCSMVSRMGYFLHTNTYGYFRRWIKSKVNIRTCKHKISIHAKEVNYGTCMV